MPHLSLRFLGAQQLFAAYHHFVVDINAAMHHSGDIGGNESKGKDTPMSKFTPGPWSTSLKRMKADNSVIIDGATQKFVAFAADFNEFARDTEVEANAQLIAAAPDLLEAAKTALFAGQIEVKLGNKAWEVVNEHLKAAIKLAEEGQ